MDKIVLDAFDIRNAENITLRGTVVLEVALSVADYLETISDSTTDLPAESQDFLDAVNDYWRYVEDGEPCEELVEDGIDEMEPGEQIDCLWCYLARHLHAYSQTGTGGRALAQVGVEIEWDL